MLPPPPSALFNHQAGCGGSVAEKTETKLAFMIQWGVKCVKYKLSIKYVVRWCGAEGPV